MLKLLFQAKMNYVFKKLNNIKLKKLQPEEILFDVVHQGCRSFQNFPFCGMIEMNRVSNRIGVCSKFRNILGLLSATRKK